MAYRRGGALGINKRGSISKWRRHQRQAGGNNINA